MLLFTAKAMRRIYGVVLASGPIILSAICLYRMNDLLKRYGTASVKYLVGILSIMLIMAMEHTHSVISEETILQLLRKAEPDTELQLWTQ